MQLLSLCGVAVNRNPMALHRHIRALMLLRMDGLNTTKATAKRVALVLKLLKIVVEVVEEEEGSFATN